MADWLKDVEPLTLKGQIAVPYTWQVGDAGSRFLVALRDDKKILGSKCPGCGTTYVPARKNCGTCFEDIDEWVEVETGGRNRGLYHRALQPSRPAGEAPLCVCPDQTRWGGRGLPALDQKRSGQVKKRSQGEG